MGPSSLLGTAICTWGKERAWLWLGQTWSFSQALEWRHQNWSACWIREKAHHVKPGRKPRKICLEAKIRMRQGLPWWRSGWESACQCRGHGFEHWSGGIPHAAEQLGPWATTTEPEHLEPVLRNERGRDSEEPAHRDEDWPPLATAGESPHAETGTQRSQK